MKKNVLYVRLKNGLKQKLLMMKLTAFFLVVTFLQVSAGGYSQNISISLKNVSVDKLFKEIENQSGYRFFYNEKIIKNAKAITIDIKDASVETVLQKCFKEQSFSFIIDNKQIIIKEKEIVTPDENGNSSLPPPVIVKGKVSDENGKPLQGVSVLIKGTNIGTSTDANGEFEIELKENASKILIFSFVGMESQEANMAGKDFIEIKLKAQIAVSSEVVVVGYGTQRKVDVTGAITSITSKALTDVPSSNLSQALQGQGAGVDIQKNNGNSRPGQVPSILIRGARSVKADNGPLFVVDGIPFDGNINDLNVDDIASVEVLKDASSTAIYGSRGANGVILVTTKRGNAGPPIITYSGYVGLTNSLGEFPMMTGSQFTTFKKWANFLGKPGVYTSIDDPKILTDNFTAEELQGVSNNRNTDWQKQAIKQGISTNHQLGFSGGTDLTKYSISTGYHKETGVYPGQAFERFSIRLNLDQQLSKIFKVGISSMTTYTNTQGENKNILLDKQNPMDQVLKSNPLVSPYDSSGNILNTFVPGNSNQVWNILANFVDGAVVEKRKRLGTFTTLYAEANIARGLKYRFNAGAQLYSDDYGNFYAGKTTFNQGGLSKARNFSDKAQNYTMENILTYNKTIASIHRIGFTGLFSYQNNVIDSTSFSYSGLLSDNAQYFNPSLGSNLSGTGARSEFALISYMARVNYSLNNKYLLTLTSRIDASSRLASGNQYHNFPSAALGWNISREAFMQNSKTVSNLKLRLSYGSVGNTSISPYQTLGSLAPLVYNYGTTNTTGLYPNSVPNPSLGWEYTSTANLGVDFGFFRNRISGSLDFYHSYTRDMILPQSLPATSGIPSTILTNIGKSENKGIELHISSANIQSASPAGFNWIQDINFAMNRGQITQLSPTLNTFVNGKPGDIGNSWFVGQPIGAIYDYQKIGIWQNTASDIAAAQMLGLSTTGTGSVIGQVKIADRNGNKRIDANDRYIVGNPQPNWQGGITERFSYNYLDFTFVANARFGSTIISSLYTGGTNTLQGVYNNINLNYWTPNNPTNDFPKPTSAQTSPPYSSTLSYFDGSFLKIRSLALGYTVPQSKLNTRVIKSLRFYANANDAFILFSPYRNKYGLDPETSGSLTNDTPPTWSIVFGVNLTM